MNERIRKLREQSLNAIPGVSLERARLLTEFHQSGLAEKVSIPVARALAFKYILENKEICINEGELIVGERGPSPKATPTYPEICAHTLEDLDILDSREKVSFKVASKDKTFQHDVIIPFWSGRSIRDRIFESVDPGWIDAYEAGIFTEFQEQRAPGHTVLDNKIYKKGFLDFKLDIGHSLECLDFFNDPEAYHKREELKAMDIAADAIIQYAKGHADQLYQIAEDEMDISRKKELVQMAEICEWVPAHAPRNFWEALQYYWFVHLGVITELNTWDSFNPGRLDQHLLPFYEKDVECGSLTDESARELLQSFWVKFNNQPAPPKVGVTAEESNTYTDFCLINLGGVNEQGENAVNEMTYMILDIIEEMRLLQPSSMVQISKKNPDRLLKRALKIIKTGYGQPSLFNTDAIVQELIRQGKSVVDARNGGASGCVETGAFGKESYILTGYFNLPKVLEITLNNGVDPRTGKGIGIKTGDPRQFNSFDELYVAYEKQLNHFIDIKIKGNVIIERLWADYLPAPFLSILIDDCIANGKDYNNGGARYNTSYIQGVGLGSITDSLSAIKYHVFDHGNISMSEMLDALAANFDGYESLNDKFLNEPPKYGNDDDYADMTARRVFDSYFGIVDGRPNTKGGHFRINMLPTTCHVYFGRVIGALPDGRPACQPLSEGISPVQGADRKGPTAVLKSAAKIDHIRTGGTLLNQKFTPQMLADDDGITKLAHLIRAYFTMDGHHIQFNVVDAATLREAQKHPEKYRDLIVRVAGYSDYFVDLGTDLQNEIIKRTEQSIS
ncbi:MAG: formate C-acetyltransferase/glycerol dehydratase family glycyl radical enzyme [candidate division Zixibacteria bacterium HGW-Zixibacteria-1]|nr:MAG: formate C-acetyltransferase/glycerol dehydratase family glycyl radical enzyme [candidate division Zixibacteria bacterium HGW-Zixibacteria-1]